MRTAVNCLLIFLSFSAHAFLNSVENRMTYPEFVSKKLNGVPQALSLYSAAGKFSCTDTSESGAVVGRNDVVVMAAHSVMISRKGQCVKKPQLAKCYFQTISFDGSLGRKILIDPTTLSISSKYRCNDDELDNDWAIAKLKSGVNEVREFEFEEGTTWLKGASIYVFASNNANFSNAKAPTICEGKIGFVWKLNSGGASESFAVGTDCSASSGNSGGAIVVIDESSPKYVGLISAGTKDAGRASLDINNFSGGPLLTTEFLAALMRKVPTPVVSK